jgi:hypothetical protein
LKRRTYTYNYLGFERFNFSSPQALSDGKATILFDFAMKAAWAKAAWANAARERHRLVAEGRIEHTQCCIFSADEGTDIGTDNNTPVIEHYEADESSKF